jgi:hypothetical protein
MDAAGGQSRDRSDQPQALSIMTGLAISNSPDGDRLDLLGAQPGNRELCLQDKVGTAIRTFHLAGIFYWQIYARM